MGKAPEHILRDALQGQEAAFLRLFDQRHVALFRFAWRLTGSVADAEDIVQDCFLALLRPECSFDPARTSIRNYRFGAVRNQWLKRLRQREQPVTPEPADHHTPESQALRAEIANFAAGAVSELPETQREGVWLAHYEQLSRAEIAEITQLEVTAVKLRLQRARATPKETLAALAPRTERTI